MSFHQDIVAMTPFVPHAFADLVAMRAFPAGAIPEPVYQRLCEQYAALDDVEMSRIVYTNDGLHITGVIAAPKAQKPAGLIMYNRGGSGNFGLLAVHTLMRQFVPLVRAGYVVASSNYRGNDGGEGKDKFGGRDVDDVVKLHEIMRAHKLVDGKPCFVIGHSRGGMMTYLLMKRGLPMRAAIAIAAVSDLRGWNSIRPEIVENVYKRYIPGFEANEEALLAERSAICWPLLLLHGTNDDRVPHDQSEKLAAKLTSPYELVLFPGGNHTLTRDWPEVLRHSEDWMKLHA